MIGYVIRMVPIVYRLLNSMERIGTIKHAMSNDKEAEHHVIGSGNGSRHENNKTPLQNEREEEESRRLVNSSSSHEEQEEEGGRDVEEEEDEEEISLDHQPCVSFGDELMWWKGEIQVLTQLAVPSMIINMTIVAPDFLCSSYIGTHYGPVHFSGFALSTLTINIFLGTLLQGFFSARYVVDSCLHPKMKGLLVGPISLCFIYFLFLYLFFVQ